MIVSVIFVVSILIYYIEQFFYVNLVGKHVAFVDLIEQKSKKRAYDRGQNRFQQWPDCSDTCYHDVQ